MERVRDGVCERDRVGVPTRSGHHAVLKALQVNVRVNLLVKQLTVPAEGPFPLNQHPVKVASSGDTIFPFPTKAQFSHATDLSVSVMMAVVTALS
jgi:hypothetical protein